MSRRVKRVINRSRSGSAVASGAPLVGARPRGDRVIVRREAARNESAGGIILPDSVNTLSRCGVICAVGPGKLRDDGTHIQIDLTVGQRVLFSSFSGDIVGSDGDLLILREEDIIAEID